MGIEQVMKDIDKRFGVGTVRTLADDSDLDIECVSSGSINLDLALGKGVPMGRILEIYGPEAGGKTTIALLMAAEFQKKFPDDYVAFIDVEHALNPDIAEAYGVNPEKFVITQPDSAENAIDIAEAFARSGDVRFIVIDSVSALVPNVEAEEDMEKQTMGLVARLMSKALRKLTPVASKHDCTIAFINQIREKIGVNYGEKNILQFNF